MAQIRYEKVARSILQQSYSLADSTARTTGELLQMFGPENAVEHILDADTDRKIEDRLEQLTTKVRAEIERFAQRRMTCPLVESSIAPGSFVPNLMAGTESGAAEIARMSRLRTAPAMEEVLCQLTPDEFEEVCGLILTAIGCTAVTVTQSTKDDGVDAIAALSMELVNTLLTPTPLFYRVIGGLSFLMFAQAKRYALDHLVGKEEVVELQGSWAALANEYADGTIAAERRAALERADYRAADPVLLLMMTTSTLTAGAAAKAAALGMIALDGAQIAQLLVEADIGLEFVGEDAVPSVAALTSAALAQTEAS